MRNGWPDLIGPIRHRLRADHVDRGRHRPSGSEGFITVGNAPAPRQQTPAAGTTGPPAPAFPPRPTTVQPGIMPPGADGPPQPER